MSDRRKRELSPDSPSKVFGIQVAAARGQKRPPWSQARLEEELEKVGSPIDRAALQKIEQGARKGVTLEEVFEIAVALDVNPVQLFTPPEDPDDIEKPEEMDAEEWALERLVTGEAGPKMQVTQTRKERAQAVRLFFYGHRPLSLGTPDPALYRRFISDPEHARHRASEDAGYYSRESEKDEWERHSLPASEGRKSKVVRKKRPKRKG